MSWSVQVDPVVSSFLTGRLRGADTVIPPIELWIDSAFEAAETLSAADPAPFEFTFALPRFCFDGQEHSLEVRFANQVFEQQFRTNYDGFLDPFSNNLITGWVLDMARPGVPVEVELELNGAKVGRTLADVFREGRPHGFRYQLPQLTGMHRSFVVRALIAGTDIDLQRSPVLSLARPRLVRAVQQFNFAFHYLEQRLMWDRGGRGPEPQLTEEERSTFADLLLEGTNVADILELRRRFIRPLQPQLTEHYARRDYATLGIDFPGSMPRRIRGVHRDRPVDIIVPIYAGYRQTQRCLDSVLASAAGCRYELTCVLDNPEDGELRDFVLRLAEENPQVTVIENETSKGFAESVNSVMRLHRDRDVLILHSDCEVHGDWLGRLQRAAYEGAGAGLVNPLTDQGEFLTYPSAGIRLPADAPFELLDKFARQANRHVTVQTPAAMGFCLYVRRGCLDDLGFFHNDQPSGGYYAEKYFSVNAAALGWRSILAADVFVKHHGYVSFLERDINAVDKAREAFELWCPFYQDSVTDFLVDDPALPAKRELDLARMEVAGQDRFCFIAHSGGGGTERHLQELSEALANDSLAALVLYSLPGRRVYLSTPELEGIENLSYNLDTEWDQLVRDLKRLRVKHVHIHSNVEVERDLFSLPSQLGAAYDITVHDYAWFCPRVNLVNHSGVYCGEPPVSVCETCSGTDVKRLVEISQQQLQGARRVFCPSDDARQRMERHFDLRNISVRPHPEWFGGAEQELDPGVPYDTVTVATIGRISTHKGLRVLRQCAAHAMEWGLPLQFAVIGGTADDAQFDRLTNVAITGAYREQEVDGLLKQHGARVALLPSVWPETYSYTLSVALRNGLFPVAFDLGAIAERIRLSRTGTLLPLGTPASQINEALLHAGRQARPSLKPRGARYLNMLRDYYGLK